MSARVLPAGPEAVAEALRVIARGELVILPHATNYNVVCDADDPRAVEAVFQAKRRVKLGPLPVCLPDAAAAHRYVHVPEWFPRAALDALWPGEVCFVFRQRHPFPARLTCGLGTVAVTVSSDPVYSAVARAGGRALASSSANLSGTATGRVTLARALADLGHAVALAIDAGGDDAEAPACGNTIVDLTHDRPHLVRAGAVPVARVRAFLPDLDEDTERYQRRMMARAVQSAQGAA